MKTVWVAEFENECADLNAVFSTKEKAEKYNLENAKRMSEVWKNFGEIRRQDQFTCYEFYISGVVHWAAAIEYEVQ